MSLSGAAVPILLLFFELVILWILLHFHPPTPFPSPRFPVNLDVVTVQNFDAFLAKKFFVVSE